MSVDVVVSVILSIVCRWEIVALQLPRLGLEGACQGVTDSVCEVISLECTELRASIVAVAIHAGLVIVVGQSSVIHVKMVD